jgi:hypothetical protein
MTTQHPNESAKAFHAYCCYEELGPTRTIALAYAKYRDRPESSVKPSASFIGWKSEFRWDDRAMAYDLEEESRQRAAKVSIDDDAYKEELEQFRRLQLNAGKQGVAIVLNLKKKLLDWVETHPAIESLRDALVVARIIATLEMSSSEQWAKAIHIDILLSQMDETESE